jgi:endonuclease IV
MEDAMPLFGAHQSIAGGLHNALLLAQAHGMDTVQLFVTNPRSWPDATPPSEGKTDVQFGKLLTKALGKSLLELTR